MRLAAPPTVCLRCCLDKADTHQHQGTLESTTLQLTDERPKDEEGHAAPLPKMPKRAFDQGSQAMHMGTVSTLTAVTHTWRSSTLVHL